MKHIKRYRELFESELTLTPEQINWLDECTGGTWELNSQTGLVDVDGNFICSEQNLGGFKGVRFGKVTGDFRCDDNSLTSLEGAPQKVGGEFYCRYNSLVSLEGAPQEVGGGFSCIGNSLTSLEGSPQKVGGYFICNNNSLTSLEGSPQEVRGDFSCNNNSLTSLEGSPQKVRGDFSCSNNSLVSLEGAPQEVGGDFTCENNSLESLEGAPQKVGGDFYCLYNPVSGETLQKIWNEMKEGLSYSEALKRLATDIPKEDWDLLDKSGLEVSDKFLRGASVLRRLF